MKVTPLKVVTLLKAGNPLVGSEWLGKPLT
jgi:hypothetical protein